MIGKKVDTVIIVTMVLMAMALYGYGQAPLGINYQGIARNMDGTPKSEQPISIRVSILDGGISGIVEYSEIHEVVTNQFGLFALVIGQGDKIGDIQNIEWSTGDKWLQVEMDAEGGNNFEIIGAQQIFSVPYAMYASQSGTEVQGGVGISVEDNIISNMAPDQPVTLLGAGNVMVSGSYPDFIITGTENVDDADNNPSNELQTLDQQGTDVILSNDGGTISIEDADADPANEIQDASQVAVTPQGNISSNDVQSALIELQGDIDLDTDLDPSNEIQDLSSSANGVERTIDINGGTGTTINIEDPDSDPTNELQSLSQVGNNVTLSNGGGTITVDDADSNPTNEIQSLSGVISVSNSANSNKITDLLDPTLAQDAATKNYVDTRSIEDADADPTNEIQSLSGVISVSNSANSNKITDLLDPTLAQDAATKNYVDTRNIEDADADPGNEIQSLSDVISVSNSANNNKITDLLDPTLAQDAATKNYVDTRSIEDADADPGNEIQNAGQVSVTPAGNLTSTNVQAALTELQGEIDIDGDQDPGNEIQNLSNTTSGTDRTINISGGSGTTINVADNDNSTTNEVQTLTQVGSVITLSSGGGNFDINDAGGNVITNVADPVGSNDAVNKSYLDTKVATDYAFKTIINDTGSGIPLTFDLSSYHFDEGPLITGTQILIKEEGVYMFNVKGSSSSNGLIVININNSIDYPVGLININKYSDTILLKLNVDDIIELRANTTTGGEAFNLEFFGFKI